MKLIAIPYAFGNASAFSDLFNVLDNDIKKTTIEYPGHGSRFSEELLCDMDEIVNDAAVQVISQIDSNEDYCLLGYSMGGIVAYELYYKLLSKHCKLPTHLFILGSSEPGHDTERKDYENYNTEQIKEELLEHDATPKELYESEEFLELYSPIVKSDNIALRDYKPTKRNLPIKCGVTVMRGSEEKNTENCRSGWEEFIGHPCKYHLIEGGHFFLFDDNNLNLVAKIIENEI